MWALIFSMALFTAVPGRAFADSVVLSWLPVAGASGYKVYQSVDAGTTWTLLASPATTTITLDVPGDKLVLFRVSSQSPGVETGTTDKGAWYNGAWRLAPGQLSVR